MPVSIVVTRREKELSELSLMDIQEKQQAYKTPLPLVSIMKREITEGTQDTTATITTNVSIVSETSVKEPSVKDASIPRKVTFDKVQIRDYYMYLGDNPYCSIGAPVSLSWEYEERDPKDLDLYECERTPRRKMRFLLLNYYKRNEILKNCGYSESELKEAERKLNKQHRQRASTNFFMPMNRITEVVQGAGSKLRKKRR